MDVTLDLERPAYMGPSQTPNEHDFRRFVAIYGRDDGRRIAKQACA